LIADKMHFVSFPCYIIL